MKFKVMLIFRVEEDYFLSHMSVTWFQAVLNVIFNSFNHYSVLISRELLCLTIIYRYYNVCLLPDYCGNVFSFHKPPCYTQVYSYYVKEDSCL